MPEKKETTISRRAYCKPQLEQVQLIPEEAVLQNCKAQNTCTVPTVGGGTRPSAAQGS